MRASDDDGADTRVVFDAAHHGIEFGHHAHGHEGVRRVVQCDDEDTALAFGSELWGHRRLKGH